MSSLWRWTSKEFGDSNVNLDQLRILGLDYVLRRLEVGGDKGVPEDKLFVCNKEKRR